MPIDGILVSNNINIPCELMKYDWDVGKNSEFCINIKECLLDTHSDKSIKDIIKKDKNTIPKDLINAFLAAEDASGPYHFSGVEDALAVADCDIRLFGKPVARPYRRLGVVLGPDVETAQKSAACISVHTQ